MEGEDPKQSDLESTGHCEGKKKQGTREGSYARGLARARKPTVIPVIARRKIMAGITPMAPDAKGRSLQRSSMKMTNRIEIYNLDRRFEMRRHSPTWRSYSMSRMSLRIQAAEWVARLPRKNRER
jgi:hypothetical protein